ncbi:MAG: ribonuclease P protein component 1 [Candidatus Methanoliparum thermophilum]|uniref:Ribonuclease P protein component 1 n=1 Tax=Methanoliparum thermophilum TaxID=2491083 RepID=A0A520KU00_METT2|nr:ribonuclease P protein component 1 [Candidatus Methanoliparum sp. LAM-1]RZN65520.1 MAG: ribonuclease P protein component 1 [Candidatus Methanoliparum thermophilum]BDC35385.1 ribonuclease P [Candidatus Methanoliparum sp. LAM-1]
MRLKPNNIQYHELIGLDVQIKDSVNPYLIGLSGKVIDETKNLFILQKDASIKKIPKIGTKFVFKNPKCNESWNEILIDGALLLGRPEDRIKKMTLKRCKYYERDWV